MSGGVSFLVKLEITSYNFRGVVRGKGIVHLTSKIELLAKIVNRFKQLTIFAKRFTLDIRRSSNYTPELY